MNPYALSIRQPWAWAILHAGKDVENRDWKSPPGYRGTLVVHTGARREPRGIDLDLFDVFNLLVPVDLPLGAFVGTVQLVGAHRTVPGCCASSPWAMPDATVHIQLADPRPFPVPVPGKGQLGFWRPDVALPAGAVR